MRKNLEKIFASASIVVAIVLIMILLVTVFGGIEAEEFDSKLVRGLMITLAVLYFILSAVTLTLAFVSSEAVKEIVIRSEQKGSVRASIGVVRKLVRTTCAEVDGVKCNKVALVTDEYGVRLKIGVRVVDKDVVEVETYIRTLLEDVFYGALGFRFHTIEIKVVSLQPKYKADKQVIGRRVEERLEELAAEEAANAEAVAEVTEETADSQISDVAAETAADGTSDEAVVEAEEQSAEEELSENEEPEFPEPEDESDR